MPRKPRIYLPFDRWPVEDQARWRAAFAEGDRFDGAGPGSHLAEATRRNLRISYARFLSFISSHRPDLLELRPDARVDRLAVAGEHSRNSLTQAATAWWPSSSITFVVR